MEIKHPPIPLCLIGGTGRSGTTIIKKIFRRHSKCARVPEYRFSIDPDGLVDFYLSLQTNWSPYYFDKKVKRLKRLLYAIGRNRLGRRTFDHVMRKFGFEQYFSIHLSPSYSSVGFSRFSPNYFNLVNNLIQDLIDFTYKGQWNGTNFAESQIMHYASPEISTNLERKLGIFWSAVIEDVCKHQNTTYFIDDNTWNILWFDTILKLMPHSRLIHVIRDPRDVVASYMHMRWSPNEVSQAANWYKGIINRWFEIKRNVPKNTFKEIRLEELVSYPHEIINEIADFWGISWNDRLLEQNLNKAHTGRWKKEFNLKQQQVVENILEKQIIELGFE